MNSFDPSALQDIGSSGPDIAGSMAKGFQLKDLVDQNQLNTLKLSAAKTEAADEAKAKKILSQSDLSTEKGITEASEKLTKDGMPQKGMELRVYGQKVASGELDLQRQKVDLHLEAQNIITTQVGGLWQQATAMREAKTPDGRPRYTAAAVDALITSRVPAILSEIQTDDSLPDPVKKTALGGIQQVVAKTGGKITYDQLTQFEQASKQGQEALIAHRKEMFGEKNIESEIKNRDVTRRQEDEKIGIERDKLKLAQGNASLDGMYASFADAGIQIPGRSKQTQDSTMRGLLAKYPDKSPDEIAQGVKNGQISMSASKTEGNVLARREGAILPVEKSITRQGGFLDQAEKAVNAVDFPKLKAAGSFDQWTKEQESDPALSRYKAAVAELRAEYSIVLSKGGQVTDAARHEAEKVIPDLITKDQFKAIKQVVLQGIESSKGGIEESLSGVTGKDQSTPSVTSPKANDPLGIR